MTNGNVVDPFASAVEAGERPDRYFGEINLHVTFVNLEKGAPKSAWDSQIHAVGNRRTEVEVTILPLAESGLVNPLQRSVIAESQEWTKIVWPSLRALGVKDGPGLHALHGQFAAVEFATTGRKYTDKKTGEERESTTLKFTALYPDEVTATAAWRADRPGMAAPAATNGNGHTNTNGNGHNPADDAERAALTAFLPALVKQANRDPNRLAEIIAANPMISKHFDVNSPEVIDLMSIPF